MMAGLVTAVSASLLVGVTVSTYFAIESSHRADENLKLAEREATARLEADGQRDEAEQQRKEAEKQRKEAGRNADMARRHLYVAHMNLAQNAWDGASVAAMLDFLDRCRPRDGQEDLRGFEWYYWDRRCHGDLLTLEGIGTVNSVAFTPDAKRLVSAGMSATKVWDMATGREVFTLDVSAEHHSATGAAFSPDGTRLATASFTDKVIKVWDMATGREVLTFRGHTDWVRSVAFSPDGRRLASGADRTVRLWDATTGQEIQSFKADFRQVLSVAFSPDGKRVATADITGIKVWDAATGREIMNVRADEGTVQSLAFSPDGKRLASGNYGQTVIVRDATTGQAALTLRGHKGAVQSVAFSQDGKYLASGSGDGTLKLWDAGTGQEMSTFKGHTGEVRAVAFSPDGRRLASAGDHTVKLWDTAAKPWDAERSREAAMRGQGEFLATTLAVSRDGNRLALALATGVVELRDVVTGEEILKLDGGGQQITSLAFSPDGTRLAWPSADHTVTIRDTATGKEILTFRGHKEDVGCVAFGADGKRLASVSSESLRIWDTTTGREALAVTGQPMFQSMAFSPDGKRVASSCVFEVLIWDAATGEKILTLKGHRDFVPSVAFGPDGKQLASASADGTIRVWDTATGQKIFALEAHAMGCKQVVFSPDGRRLASAGRDKTVKLWDMMTGLEILTLKTGREEANRLVFAPDGNWLVSASFEGLRLWDARPRSAANPLLPDPEQVSLAERASLLEKRISLLMKRLPGAKKVMDGGVLASWSPDAKELAVVERKGICVIDVATGLRRGLVDSGVFPAWQPKDGRWIAFVRFNQKTPWLVPELWLVEAAGGSARKLADGGRPSWSSDGETLYFHSPKQRQVVAIQPEKADAKPAAVFETAWPYPAVSGDGNRIAFCPADAGSSESSFRVTRNSVLVCDRGAGKTLIESSLPGGEKGLLLSAFSPDGKKLAFGFADSRGLWILDVEKGTKWKALDGPYAAPCWSPDGSKFAFHLCAKERQETWIVDAKVLDGLKPSEPK
jgi:WD40 repeat protein